MASRKSGSAPAASGRIRARVTDQRAKYNLAFPVDAEHGAANPRQPGPSKEEAVIRLRDLERQSQADKALYESLLSRLKEAEQQTSLPPAAETRVIAPALEPRTPSFPDKKRNMIIALLGGVAAGLGLALLLERLERGFSTLEQLKSGLRRSVLAAVPKLTPRERQSGDTLLSLPEYMLQKPLSRFSESVRSIRLSVQLANPDDLARVLMVTSSISGEGKSTIALCLAHSAAVAGKRVLLIDSDFRHPSLSKDLLKESGPGLTDLLTDDKLDRDAYCREIAPNMSFLAAGTVTGHPPDFIGSEKLRMLLQELGAGYDLVVLDTPPVIPVVDSILLSRLVDRIVFVVSWRTTPRYVAERAVNSLDERDRKIAGIAFNNVAFEKAQTLLNAYHYDYGGHHKNER